MSTDKTALLDSRTDLNVVPGWFGPSDQVLFRWFLARQSDQGVTGNVIELGAYLGKSAVLIGDHVQAGETFTIVDLFGAEAGDVANAAENLGSYSTLTRSGFEENYLKFHSELPDVHTALSSAVTSYVEPASVRFLHIDASHLYEHVVGDTTSARTLLQPEGVVVYDDYRSEHTPGVAAAVWEAVLIQGLKPICITPTKLYGTWGDPTPWRDALADHLRIDLEAWFELQVVAGHDLIRCKIGENVPTREDRLREALERKDQALTEARRRLKRQRAQVEQLRSSTSFRVGSAITAPLRAFRSR